MTDIPDPDPGVDSDPGIDADESNTTKESKAVRTRTSIIDAALRLFRERGYEATTMRAIASEAGVSVGNAYYYFESKEHLIQAFYDRTQSEHAQASASVLANEVELSPRIVGVIEAWIDVMEPFRVFAGTFFKNAAEPTSPLSPFSPDSAPAREVAISLWRTVIEGSETRIPKALRAQLPQLLWLYFIGIVLFWVHDTSDGAARTRLLADRTAPMVVRAIGLARLPVLRSTLNDLLDLFTLITEIDS